MTHRLAFGALVFVLACGGTAIVDPGSGGAGGSTGGAGAGTGGIAGTGAGGTTASSSASGPSGCMAHEQCPDGNLCLFETGECVPSCGGVCDPCGPGAICDDCATASCPTCKDCAAACVPLTAGQCDDDDPCVDGAEVCVFGISQCVPECGPGGDCGGSLVCEGCVTSSCCGCDDCVPACVPI